MNKKTKIKRHYSIYKTTSPWKRGLKISLFVLGLLVLGFVGYSVYAPVMDFISGESESSVSSVSLSSEEVSQSSSSSSSETSVSSSYESSGIAVSTALEQCFAAPLTQDIAKEPASLSSYLSLLSQKGYTAVVFEAKDQEGILHYQSASGTARSSGAIADDAVDLAAVARECRVKGISLYTLMYAFEDHYAGLADPSMAIKYSGDEGVYWLDDYAENGGKTWLNPFSSSAQTYISQLMEEMLDAGASAVILDGFYFPTVAGSETAYYGAGTPDKPGILRQLLSSFTSVAESKGGAVCLRIPALAAAGLNMEAYGGVNPLAFGEEYALLDLRLSGVPSFTLKGTTVPIPSQNPEQSLQLLLAAAKSAAGEGVILIGLLDGGLSVAETQLQVQRDILLQNGITGILVKDAPVE